MSKYDPVMLSRDKFQELEGFRTQVHKLLVDIDHAENDVATSEQVCNALETIDTSFASFLDDVSQTASMQWASVESRHWHVYEQADPGALSDNAETFDSSEAAREAMWAKWNETFGASWKDGPVVDMPYRFTTNGVDAVYSEECNDPDCELWQEFLAERDNTQGGFVTGEPR